MGALPPIGTAPICIRRDEQDDGDHLEDGLELAEIRCGDDLALARGDHAHAGYDELARHDDEHDPARKRTELYQDQQRRHDEDLIGQRIEELAEIGDFVALARQVPVEPVRRGYKDEDRGGDPALPIRGAETDPFGPRTEDGDHEDGDEQDADDGDDVRGRLDVLVGMRRVSHGRSHLPSRMRAYRRYAP
mgnify:CR=1 FL=1